MSIQVSHFYIWKLCNKIHDTSELFNILGISNKRQKHLDKLKAKQINFAKLNEVPMISLAPLSSIPTEIQLKHQNSSIKISKSLIRYWIFEYGYVYTQVLYEVTDKILATKKALIDRNKLLIRGKKIISNIIYSKLISCVDYQTTFNPCLGCQNNEVIYDFTIYRYSNDQPLMIDPEKKSIIKFKSAEFYVSSNSTNLYLVSINKQEKPFMKHFMNSLVFSLLLIRGINRFGKSILDCRMTALMKVNPDTKEIFAQLENKFLKTFFFLYYWANLDMLGNSEDENMAMSWMEREIFNDLSKIFIKKNQINSRLMKQLSSLNVRTIVKINKIVNGIPGVFIPEWIEYLGKLDFNPFPHWTTMPELNPLQEKIIGVMMEEYLTRIDSSGTLDLKLNTEMAKLSANRISKRAGYSGSGYYAVKTELERLVKNKILNKQENQNKTRVNAYYFLSPSYPPVMMINSEEN